MQVDYANGATVSNELLNNTNNEYLLMFQTYIYEVRQE